MSIHDTLERTKLPVIVVIAIPILAVLYVVLGTNAAPASSPSPSQTQQIAQPSAPSPLPAASISLDDPSSLPAKVSAAQLVPFSFTVQNTSNQSVTYQYKVSVRWSTGEENVIDANSLSLAPGASQTVPEQLKFEIATETAEVYFQMPQTAQSLHFIVPRTQ